MLLIDLTHTSHTRARTGIQQVCRSLYAAYPESAVTGITHDPYRRSWRELAPWEKQNLVGTTPGAKRGAKWPLRARLASSASRLLAPQPRLPAATGLIVPEVFSAKTATAFPQLFNHVAGPKVAVFHDAIALKLPEMSPAKTVARFPAYLEDLLAFDGIAAVSNDSRQSLVEYWDWIGHKNRPQVLALPLPLLRDRPRAVSSKAPPRRSPTVLSVGTLEGRKNHLALLDACEALWMRGLKFELRLIGFAQAETGAAALKRVQELQAKGRSLRYDGAVNDETLDQAYRDATFTVYPSLLEGFGLPVLESLAYGKPCICSGRGALGESGKGGGCVLLDRVDSTELADAIASLIKNPAMVAMLATDANRRTFRTWADYQRDLHVWLTELPVRSPKPSGD